MSCPGNEAKNLLGYTHLWEGSNVSKVPTSVVHWNWEFLPRTCKHLSSFRIAGSNVSKVPTSVIHWNWEFLPSTCKHRIVAIYCHFNLLPYSQHNGNYCKLLEITGDYEQLLEITRDYWRLLQITRDYWRNTFRKLPSPSPHSLSLPPRFHSYSSSLPHSPLPQFACATFLTIVCSA